MKKDLKKIFGQKLCDLRKSKGISQEELADYAKVDRSFISNIETGKFYPSLLIIYKLSEHLKIKPAYLFLLVDNEIFE